MSQRCDARKELFTEGDMTDSHNAIEIWCERTRGHGGPHQWSYEDITVTWWQKSRPFPKQETA